MPRYLAGSVWMLESVGVAGKPQLRWNQMVNPTSVNPYAGLDRFGRVIDARWYDYDGAADVERVQYGYDAEENTLRLNGMRYPSFPIDENGLEYGYGSEGGDDDLLSRVASIITSIENLGVSYTYFGRSSFASLVYTEPVITWNLTTGGTATNPYAGLDRFGRVIDCPWHREDYLERVQYGYDAAGNRVWRHNSVAPAGNDELYGYDGLHRLVEMARGTLAMDATHIDSVQYTQDWTLDPTGNWNRLTQSDVGDPNQNLDQSRWQNAANEITQIARRYGAEWVTPSYDGVGNMTLMPKPLAPTQSFSASYDAWNRLTTIGTSTYAYDGLNRRIRAPHESGGTREFYYTADWRLVETRHASLPTQSEYIYIWGQRYIDDLVLLTAPTTGTSVDPPENHYALQDANWNVTAFCENTGDILERFRYTPYGVPTFLNADFEPIDPNSFRHWRILYAGYWWDNESGLYQVRNRYLHPMLGGWLTRDPVVEDLNLYLYVMSNPTNYVDPMGLQIEGTLPVAREFPWQLIGPALAGGVAALRAALLAIPGIGWVAIGLTLYLTWAIYRCAPRYMSCRSRIVVGVGGRAKECAQDRCRLHGNRPKGRSLEQRQFNYRLCYRRYKNAFEWKCFGGFVTCLLTAGIYPKDLETLPLSCQDTHCNDLCGREDIACDMTGQEAIVEVA